MTQSDFESQSMDYVITQIEHIHAQQRRIGDTVIQRANLHILIASGAVVVLLTFTDASKLTQDALGFAALVLAGILMLGLLIYAEMTQWVMTIIGLDRESARVKRYFHDKDAALDDYFGTQHDDRPVVVKRARLADVLRTNLGAKQIVTVLNNWIGGAMVACLILAAVPQCVVLALSLGGLAFVIIWLIQFGYARLRYHLEEEDSKRLIRFPRSSEAETNSAQRTG